MRDELCDEMVYAMLDLIDLFSREMEITATAATSRIYYRTKRHGMRVRRIKLPRGSGHFHAAGVTPGDAAELARLLKLPTEALHGLELHPARRDVPDEQPDDGFAECLTAKYSQADAVALYVTKALALIRRGELDEPSPQAIRALLKTSAPMARRVSEQLISQSGESS
jgi:hypothetical protein